MRAASTLEPKKEDRDGNAEQHIQLKQPHRRTVRAAPPQPQDPAAVKLDDELIIESDLIIQALDDTFVDEELYAPRLAPAAGSAEAMESVTVKSGTKAKRLTKVSAAAFALSRSSINRFMRYRRRGPAFCSEGCVTMRFQSPGIRCECRSL